MSESSSLKFDIIGLENASIKINTITDTLTKALNELNSISDNIKEAEGVYSTKNQIKSFLDELKNFKKNKLDTKIESLKKATGDEKNAVDSVKTSVPDTLTVSTSESNGKTQTIPTEDTGLNINNTGIEGPSGTEKSYTVDKTKISEIRKILEEKGLLGSVTEREDGALIFRGYSYNKGLITPAEKYVLVFSNSKNDNIGEEVDTTLGKGIIVGNDFESNGEGKQLGIATGKDGIKDISKKNTESYTNIFRYGDNGQMLSGQPNSYASGTNGYFSNTTVNGSRPLINNVDGVVRSSTGLETYYDPGAPGLAGIRRIARC